MPTVKTSSTLPTAMAADAALAAYLRTLAEARAAALAAEPSASAGLGRWVAAPLARGHYQRVVPLRELRLQRAVSLPGEPRAAQQRGVR